MVNRKRKIRKVIYVKEDENKIINEKMNNISIINFSDFARKMILDGQVVKHDFKDLKSLTGELGKIGSNINQIAKRANESENIDKKDIENILLLLGDVKRIMNNKIGKILKDRT